MQVLQTFSARWSMLLTAALALLAINNGFIARARATPLPPGQTVTPDDTGSPLGAHLVGFLDQPFTASNGTSFSGRLHTSVFNSDPNNTNGPAALTFLYLLDNNATSSD